jgi:hypothetical protein
MSNNIKLRGTGGELRHGYRVAARLKQWEITYGVLTSPDADIDTFWANEEGAKSLRLIIGRSEWTWRDVKVSGLTPTLIVDVSGPVERVPL